MKVRGVAGKTPAARPVLMSMLFRVHPQRLAPPAVVGGAVPDGAVAIGGTVMRARSRSLIVYDPQSEVPAGDRRGIETMLSRARDGGK